MRVCKCKIVCLLYFLNSCRYELRVRYLPKSFHELYAKDKVTFYYLYDQVRILSQDFKKASVFMIYLPYYSTKTYVVGTQMNLDEMVHWSTHNICFG